MKPRRLLIEGLRSHRVRTEIDFTDVSLFAIVGDTGSGKSSILEAIVYALYAAATWSRQPGELISDGVRTMTVELTFEVDGRLWLVRRSMSRGGYPPPIHLLTAVDDPSVRFDSAAAVDAQVERLLGLSVDAFCSAVILPQGHFERLLNATPAERTRILKGIFRLERLDEARDLAKTLVDRYRPAFEELRIRRAALLPDPSVAAAAARSRMKVADATSTTMSDLLKQIDARGAKADVLNRDTALLNAEAASLRLANDALDFRLGDRLAAIAASLESEMLRLVAEAKEAAASEARAASAVEEARGQALDPVRLASFRSAIEQAQARLPQLSDRSRRLDAERLSIRQEMEQLVKDTAAVEELAAAATQAGASSAAAHATAASLVGALAAAQVAIADWEAASTQIQERDVLAKAHANDAALARAASDATGKRVAAAISRREAAERRFKRAMQKDAAVTAAHGHEPGDACPICARPLPKTWEPPVAPALEAANSTLTQAREDWEGTEREARDANTRAVKAEQRLAVTNEQLAVAERELKSSTENVKALLPDFAPGMDVSNAARSLEERGVEATQKAKVLVKAADDANAAETGARTSVHEREGALNRRSAALTAGLADVDADMTQVRTALEELPTALTLAMPPRRHDFARVIAVLVKLEADARSRQTDLERAQAKHKDMSEAIRGIERRRREEVEAPQVQYREGLGRLASAIERAETYVGMTPEAGLDGANREFFEARASAVVKSLADRIDASIAQVAELEEEQRQLLVGHKVGRREEVVEEAKLAADDRAVAAADLGRANGQIPEAAALDSRIVIGGSLVETLAELARLLGDGQFIGYVVEARQRSLLGIASTILIDMSGGHYGFSDGFQIVDRTSGQPRSTKTLSGGETFQASLALALGLVELAGRSGGRLSSLFLDEGFGTLDANALDEALEELERRAASGRVIGVISHLRAVADRIEHVLRVDKEQGRTQVRWLDGGERERLGADDLPLVGLTS